MNLKYKILWFEDDDMIGTKRRIYSYLEEFGFDIEITKYETLEAYKSKVNTSEIFFKDFDLILLDFHLDEDNSGNGETTEEILEKIQKLDFCSEVIFYSDKNDFYQEIMSKFSLFQGVFWHNGRDNLFDEKIKPVIDLTLKKSQDLNNLRGLVMAETADLDSLKKEILYEYFKSNEIKKEEIKNKIIKNFDANLKKSIELLDKLKLKNDVDFQIFFEDMADLFTKSRNVHRINKNLTNKKEFEHENFYTEIIEPRNNLAHVIEEILPDGEKILKGKKTEMIFSPDYCKDMRKKIKKYKDTLKEIRIEVDSLEKIKEEMKVSST